VEGLGQEGDDERKKVGASHHGICSTTDVTVVRATAFESSHINAALPKPLHEEGCRLRGLGTGAAQIGSPPCLIFGVGSLWPCPLLHFLSSFFVDNGRKGGNVLCSIDRQQQNCTVTTSEGARNNKLIASGEKKGTRRAR
jgi:hypothetical protein